MILLDNELEYQSDTHSDPLILSFPGILSIRQLPARSHSILCERLPFALIIRVPFLRGPAQVMQALLDRGADVTLINSEGWSPLHLAARAGNADKVQLLLAAQAPASTPNHKQGNTPLHLAAINGHAAACKVLIE